MAPRLLPDGKFGSTKGPAPIRGLPLPGAPSLLPAPAPESPGRRRPESAFSPRLLQKEKGTESYSRKGETLSFSKLHKFSGPALQRAFQSQLCACPCILFLLLFACLFFRTPQQKMIKTNKTTMTKKKNRKQKQKRALTLSSPLACQGWRY